MESKAKIFVIMLGIYIFYLNLFGEKVPLINLITRSITLSLHHNGTTQFYPQSNVKEGGQIFINGSSLMLGIKFKRFQKNHRQYHCKCY
jgi:hypothetical protein